MAAACGTFKRVAAILVASCITAGAQDDFTIARIRLQRLQELNAANESDSGVTNAVLNSRRFAELSADTDEALNTALVFKNGREDMYPNSVASFLRQTDRPPREVGLLLNEMLALDDRWEQTGLLRAARPFGIDDVTLTAVVRLKLRDTKETARIYAAAALTRLAPRDDTGHSILREFLASDKAGILWRAAEAWGESTGDDPVSARRILALLRHDDARVRIAAAYNRWKKVKEPSVSLPILIDALAGEELPMPMAYISPSQQGQSHRTYIARALGALRRDGADVVEPLLALTQTFEKSDPEDHVSLETALAAIHAIASGGPVHPATAARLEKFTTSYPIFRRYPEFTQKALEDLRVLQPE